jgi:hypothetical protein
MDSQLEPCVACGENTAPGSPFYFDRTQLDPGPDGPRYLCSSCVQRVLGERSGRRPLTDDERRALERGALAFGAFLPGGH